MLLITILLPRGPASGTVDKALKRPIRGLFYEVGGSAKHPAKSKVYLLGSIHLADDSLYPLPAPIEDAFRASASLVVEADIGQDAPGLAAKLLSTSFFRADEGKTLKSSVTPECYAEVRRAAEELGLPMSRLTLMKPWRAAATFESIQAMQAGLNQAKGLDVHFLNAARGVKPIIELEGIVGQLEMFDALPADQQNAMLCVTVRDRALFKADLEQLLKVWRMGDAAGMDAVLKEGAKRSPELKPFVDAIITQRNDAMSERLAAFLEGPGDHFIVVGSAHLVGSTGIVAQLRRRGFSVAQH